MKKALTVSALLILAVWALIPSTQWSSQLPYRVSTTQWRDQLVPMLTLSQGAAPCTIGAYGASGSIRQYRCAVGKDLDGALQLNHDYKIGTDLHCHVHWSPIDADVGYVRWALDYYWSDTDTGPAGAAPTTIYAEQVSGGTAWVHQFVEFTDISAGGTKGLSPSSMLIFRFHRVAATAGGPDEYNAAAVPLAMDCHYEADSVGSREELVK